MPLQYNANRHIPHQGLIEGRKVYGAAKKAFLNLNFATTVKPELELFSDHIGKWVVVNNKAVEISKGLIDSDLTNPTILNNHMNEFEIAHQSLLAKTGKLLAFILTNPLKVVPMERLVHLVSGWTTWIQRIRKLSNWPKNYAQSTWHCINMSLK
jgi:hypothetical protein